MTRWQVLFVKEQLDNDLSRRQERGMYLGGAFFEAMLVA